MGRRTAWTSIVEDCRPDCIWRETITSGSTLMEVCHTFYTIDTGTRFTLTYDIRARGFLKLLVPVVAYIMRRQVRENLQNLKKILEARN